MNVDYNGSRIYRKSSLPYWRFREWDSQEHLAVTEEPLPSVCTKIVVETLKMLF